MSGCASLQELLPHWGTRRPAPKRWRIEYFATARRVSPCFTTQLEAESWAAGNLKPNRYPRVHYTLVEKNRRYGVVHKHYVLNANGLWLADMEGALKSRIK